MSHQSPRPLKKQKTEQSSLSELPDDLIVQILSHVTLQTLVQVLTVIPHLGPKIRILDSRSDRHHAYYPLEDVFIRAINLCPGLTHVYFIGCPTLTDACVVKLGQGCPNLTHVYVSCCRISDTSVLYLASMCPRLMFLDYSFTWISDAELIGLAKNCPRLTNLTMRNTTNVTDTGLLNFAKRGLKITQLGLYNCNTLTSVGLKHLFENFTGLKSFFLVSYMDEAIVYLSDHCPDLVHFYMSDCGRATDTSLSRVVRKCEKLEYISCFSCPLVLNPGNFRFGDI